MHSDMKLGLGLGVLLIGVVGAFFFRNETGTDEPIPRLERAAEVDRKIERSHAHAPYLVGVEPTDSAAAETISEDSSHAASGRTSSAWKIDIPDFLKPDSPASAKPTAPSAVVRTEGNAPRADNRPVAPIGQPARREPHRAESNPPVSQTGSDVSLLPEPIPTVSERPTPAASSSTAVPSPPQGVAGIVGTPRPKHNNAWEVLPSPGKDTQGMKPLAASTQGGTSAARQAFQVHTVSPGETLSSVAARYLGSSRRYLEIFELNRDVMRTPDDLQAGMQIRIPATELPTRDTGERDPRREAAAEPSGIPARSTSRSNATGKPDDRTDSKSEKLFRPAPRSPLVPRRSTFPLPQTSQLQPQSPLTQSPVSQKPVSQGPLSQTPPSDVLGKLLEELDRGDNPFRSSQKTEKGNAGARTPQ